jgi:hypothetical protein
MEPVEQAVLTSWLVPALLLPGRRFVLSFFMMDDSLLIFEPPIRNSGIVGGKFLERQRVYKPESEDIYTYQVCCRGAPTHSCIARSLLAACVH